MGAVYIHRNVKCRFLRDLRWEQFVDIVNLMVAIGDTSIRVLFTYIVILMVVLEGPALCAVCLHRKVKG